MWTKNMGSNLINWTTVFKKNIIFFSKWRIHGDGEMWRYGWRCRFTHVIAILAKKQNGQAILNMRFMRKFRQSASWNKLDKLMLRMIIRKRSKHKGKWLASKGLKWSQSVSLFGLLIVGVIVNTLIQSVIWRSWSGIRVAWWCSG